MVAFDLLNVARTHLDGIHRPGLADHAQLVVRRALHFVRALRPHGPRQPLPRRAPGQGGQRGAAHRFVLPPVLALAGGVAVVGLRALRAPARSRAERISICG